MRLLRLSVVVLSAAAALSASVDDDRVFAHVLNRIAYGARPGDVDRVRAAGLDNYIDQQLHPERVKDEALASRLGGLQSVRMASREIAAAYEQPLLEARRARKADADAGDATNMRDPARQRANEVVIELSEQKLLRAVYSERQLQEVLTDFWFNHFNVDARKGPARFMLTEYERETIRPRVFGRFRDLLEATAKSPAMLFYLDNWTSADPNGLHPALHGQRSGHGSLGPRMFPKAQANPSTQRKNAPKGLNENYGRELLELHTLGVDGGYTQEDVTEVARAFTGWTIEKPRQGGGFVFRPQLHDSGQKVVLGHVIKPGGGQSDGEQVLDILSKQPSTATFIATKLVRHFVSDNPPATLVGRAAERFRRTDGDLREVMRTILMSAEFRAVDSYGAKAKTPFEFVVSALRASGTEVQDARPFVRMMQEMGMPLYQCQPPTGYKDDVETWINAGALVARMNAAARLADGDQTLAIRLGSPDFQRR
jgi:uncharacterized protein (DUF1800 family)